MPSRGFRQHKQSVKRLTALFGAASYCVLSTMAAQAQQADAAGAVEEVLVTGSLIHGAAAVGVPVTALGAQDFKETGAISITDLLKIVPSVSTRSSSSTSAGGGNAERFIGVDIHGLNANTPRTLMMIDGMRFPAQAHDASFVDPSIVPQLAVDRIDVLADGASATYGSDAVAGVVNVILRRNFDGAISQAQIGTADGGDMRYSLSQLYGKTWDSGDIAVTYQLSANEGVDRDHWRDYFTYDFTPYGFNDTTPIRSADPGIVSTGAPNATVGTGCTNCYSVPKGQDGKTLAWGELLANPGVKNLVNPYDYGSVIAPQQQNAAALTFDQRVAPGVQFFVDAFYSNRRTELEYPPTVNPYSTANIITAAVPTSNPFYPAGAPAGLRVSYNFNAEFKTHVSAVEIAGRWAGGFNFELPYDWTGKIFYAANEEKTQAPQTGLVNANNVSAALGNTVAAVAASGNIPGQAAFTKPANIPYLNLFCDPTAFSCNDKATLDYIQGYLRYDSLFLLKQWGANFDGPLFDLPGGPVRAAIGASYHTENFVFTQSSNYNQASNALIITTPAPGARTVYAGFVQLNVLLVGEANALPLIQKLDLEASYRYDHYSDFGGTKNPKLAANWLVADGLTVRGSWGTSFRAPGFSDFSTIAGKQIQPVNIAAGNSTNAAPACLTVGGTPTPGSAAAELNPTCSAALQFPGGITNRGAAGGLAGITRPAGYSLGPEKAKTWTVGFDFLPTDDALKGVNIGVTYFKNIIDNSLATVGLTNPLNDPLLRPFLLLPSDPGFAAAVAGLLADPVNSAPQSLATAIQFVADDAVQNIGSLKLDGIDFNAGYDWDMGDFGTWDTGIVGTYYLHRISLNIPGGTPSDVYVGTDPAAGLGNTTSTRFRWRARLGWRDESGLSVTGFVNYQSHIFTPQPLPPASYLALYPHYSNIVPSFYTFDLSVGYSLGDRPTNEYLKNIDIQLVANNVLNRDPPFTYKTSTNAGSAAYLGTSFNPFGRVVSLSVTKSW